MIILNKMYSGNYLDSEQNIGHEFINEYITDDGKQYIYVNPKDRVRKLSEKDDNYTIQVRYAGPKCYEVLSYAKIIVSSVNKVANSGKNLTYGGCDLEKLYSENTMNGKMYAHLQALELKRCKPNTYLCFDKGISLSNDATKIPLDGFSFGNQNSRRYVPKDESISESEYHDALINFINESKYWLKGNSRLSRQDIESQEINIIDVIGKQYEELTFSNWLSFYLQKSQLCKKFILECLFKTAEISRDGEADLLANLSRAEREFKNIDIWITSKKLAIVIENKIDSGINGKKITEDGKLITQLYKYWDIAQNEQRKNQKEPEDVYCFIIKPNYNQLTISDDDMKKTWKVIEYKSIYNFFDKISKEKSFKNLPYIKEFVKALYPLTQDRKKDYKDIIENRLMKRITELNKTKNK